MLNIFSKRNGSKKKWTEKNVQFLILKKSFRNKFLLTPRFLPGGANNPTKFRVNFSLHKNFLDFPKNDLGTFFVRNYILKS